MMMLWLFYDDNNDDNCENNDDNDDSSDDSDDNDDARVANNVNWDEGVTSDPLICYMWNKIIIIIIKSSE